MSEFKYFQFSLRVDASLQGLNRLEEETVADEDSSKYDSSEDDDSEEEDRDNEEILDEEDCRDGEFSEDEDCSEYECVVSEPLLNTRL